MQSPNKFPFIMPENLVNHKTTKNRVLLTIENDELKALGLNINLEIHMCVLGTTKTKQNCMNKFQKPRAQYIYAYQDRHQRT